MKNEVVKKTPFFLAVVAFLLCLLPVSFFIATQAAAQSSGTLCVCTDSDGDDFSVEGGDCGPVDCDDDDQNVYPGAEEVCNGTDDDCDGIIDNVDADLDGYIDEACAGDDCDDSNDQVNPGAPEGPCCELTCFDQLDNDCDGLIDKFNDPDCSMPCGCPPSAEASVYSTRSAMRSGALAQVGLFLIPVAQILLLRRFLRRKR